MSLNIVLVEPEIPQNTGNVARTCAATGQNLHLVKPLGFSVDDKHLKRAGLDYWHLLNIYYYNSLEHFFRENKDGQFYFSTTKGGNIYSDIKYQDDCFLIFGKETAGLPEHLLAQNLDRCIRIPMINDARSLNLSNSVAIVLYEALRQLGFKDLKLKGKIGI
ncbi:MAG: tRNA (uridine(34)/cytosine(34)/5-carboxymethylaminomethyluridine(34)-2'-O)-methyltransferase TrmL [Clostridia bacterium]|nr:tRNA (uridine(34)/cytosine(34)/5-carboxymethylaminomethyluridine(34)-2'-O)-methyltransferase TrmL [Clostridia bacterium]